MNSDLRPRCEEYVPDKSGNRIKCVNLAVYSTKTGAWCAKHDRRAALTRSSRA
mgnify:CR=1 FL=1